jgi:hypothetical protein
MGKIDKVESAQRTNQVFTMLVNGASTSEVLQYASEKWQLTGRAVYNYVQKANKLIEKQAETKRSTEMGKAMARLNNLYKSALKVQDFKTCLAVQKEINTLLGLHAPQRHDLTTNGQPLTVTFNNVPNRDSPPD